MRGTTWKKNVMTWVPLDLFETLNGICFFLYHPWNEGKYPKRRKEKNKKGDHLSAFGFV